MGKEPHSELNNLFRRNWLRKDLTAMYTVAPISTMSTSRMQAVMDAVRHVSKNNIEGDIVECGVFMGGNIALCVAEMFNNGLMKRKFWAYDTFEGVPKSELSDSDREIEIHMEGLGDSVEKWYDEKDKWCFCNKSAVELNVIETLDQLIPDVMAKDIHDKLTVYVDASVIDTIPETLPEKIAFIRLDMDIATPTAHALPHIWERLSVGGVLHIDDYNMFGGVHDVVNEFFADKKVYMQEIDYTAIAIVKVEA